MDDYQKISPENIAFFKEHLFPLNLYSSEYTAGSLIFWSMAYGLDWKITHEAFVFRMQEEDRLNFFIPDFGSEAKELVEELLEEAHQKNKKLQLTNFSQEDGLGIMEKVPGVFHLDFDRDHSDYIYNVAALVSLRGKRYHEKKNRLNRFKRTFNWEYKTLTKDDEEACVQLEEKWISEQPEVTKEMTFEREAIRKAFRYWDELSLFGGAITVDGRMAGFTVGEWLNERTTVTHFEKGMLTYDGIYQILNQQFAKNELKKRKAVYVNREEDMGIEGLRQAKTSYRPDILFHKFNLLEN